MILFAGFLHKVFISGEQISSLVVKIPPSVFILTTLLLALLTYISHRCMWRGMLWSPQFWLYILVQVSRHGCLFGQVLRSKKLDSPLLIQSYCWPPILRGRDVIGIAPRNKGQILAYLAPLLTQLIQNRPYPEGGGVSGVLSCLLTHNEILMIFIGQFAQKKQCPGYNIVTLASFFDNLTICDKWRRKLK